MNTKPRVILYLLCLLMSCPSLTSLAADKVVVIPLSGHGKTLKNVVTVAKAGGNFSDPVAAVNSITDASGNNPYLVVIGPGVYTLTHTLMMKPWVDITGSGENVTRLIGVIGGGSCDAFSSIVNGADASVISGLSVRNDGSGECSIAIYNSNASLIKMDHITAKAFGGTENYGIYNTLFSDVSMKDVTAVAATGHRNTGIFNEESTVVMMQVTAKADGDNLSYNNGIWNISCSPEMSLVTAFASDGIGNCGIRNDHASPTLSQVYAKGWGGANNYGIFNQSAGCSPRIRRSTLIGSTYAIISLEGPGTTLSTQSTIVGGSYVSGSATVQCIFCDDNSNELGKDCQ